MKIDLKKEEDMTVGMEKLRLLESVVDIAESDQGDRILRFVARLSQNFFRNPPRL